MIGTSFPTSALPPAPATSARAPRPTSASRGADPGDDTGFGGFIDTLSGTPTESQDTAPDGRIGGPAPVSTDDAARETKDKDEAPIYMVECPAFPVSAPTTSLAGLRRLLLATDAGDVGEHATPGDALTAGTGLPLTPATGDGAAASTSQSSVQKIEPGLADESGDDAADAMSALAADAAKASTFNAAVAALDAAAVASADAEQARLEEAYQALAREVRPISLKTMASEQKPSSAIEGGEAVVRPLMSTPAFSAAALVIAHASTSHGSLGGHTLLATSAADAQSSIVPAQTAQQILQEIRFQWTRGGGEAVIKLDPAHLGEMTVSVRVDQGQVAARLQAELPVVREWLDSHQQSLRQGLTDQGLTLARLEIAEASEETRHDERRESAPDQDAEPRGRRSPRRRAPESGEVFELIA